ncbi:fimbrial protein [Klebsiella aerogenes]|uniref:fimbrial protein n=1 Tax=Klebsiella aerogenes TaxID=548 RepID=UPI0009B9E684|nr:fimbrial protein [Klebsiella aerogenes]
MMRNMTILPGALLIGLLCMVGNSVALAAEAGDQTTVRITGVIQARPVCTVSSGKQIQVSFGNNVAVNRVSTGEYVANVPYSVTCGSGNTTGAALKLRVYGSEASFDAERATVVSAQQADLGVKLYQNDVPFVLNQPITIVRTALPEIKAVLVQREGATLTEGAFTATATLRAEYQ